MLITFAIGYYMIPGKIQIEIKEIEEIESQENSTNSLSVHLSNLSMLNNDLLYGSKFPEV